MKPCPDTFPFPLVALDETASTNQYLSQLCNQLQESVAELTTVTAEFQTAGKGQRGRRQEPAFQLCTLPFFSGSPPAVHPFTNRFPRH